MVAALAFLCGCSQLAYRIADKVYPSLDLPWSPENAPTATSFPPSADIRAVLGGKGEGLGCSIPGALEALFFDRDPQREPPVPLQFRQACVFHDFCYRHGHATYGYTKEDCDVMLQEHAYRLCRQIHVSDLPQEDCRKRARLTLLGVTLGGGSSFQHAHRSTYFEFDPFPARANDYVVARITRQAPAAAPGGRGADGALWTILLKHGWMTLLKFDGADWGGSDAMPFLRGKTTVPPFVIRDAERDRFLWLARPSLANTGVFAYAVDATTPEALAHTLPERMGVRGTEYTKCGDRDANHDADPGTYRTTPEGAAKPKAPYSRHEYDCNTSISKPLMIECDGRSRPLIATFGVHPWTKNFPDVMGDPLALLCAGSKSTLALASSGTGLKSHGYRFANDGFLAGRFGALSAEWGLVAFGRGHYGDDQKTRAAPEWEQNVSAIVRPFGRPASTQRFDLRLAEEDEPLAPLRVDDDPGGPDRLLALANPCFPRQDCEIEAREWHPHEWQPDKRSGSSRSSLGLSAEWLRQPAQIVSARGAPRGDWVFLSRVVSSRVVAGRETTLDDPSFVPNAVKLEYRLLRRAASGWHDQASVCVRVDLAKQIFAHRGAGLIDRYLPKSYSDWLLGKEEATESAVATPTQLCVLADAVAIQADFRQGGAAIGPRSRDQLSWEGIKACVALRRDLAARWHRSQVIPGYLYQPGEAQSQTAPHGRVPDAVFAFNGFSRHSVVIQQGEPLQGAWAKRCASD